ncbi:MAG: TetR/AcrR family transcriptional regulator [Verrucomicrobiota bacterium]
MSRKRSRAQTEQRFQDSVLSLVAESGCAQLGVNAVAHRTGSDKVLIYRYFGGIDGLLRAVATNRNWLPTVDELLNKVAGEPEKVLNGLFELIVHHIESDPATHQISLWRHAVDNPLTDKYNANWQKLWRELPDKISSHLNDENRQLWTDACNLTSLLIQSELAGESIDMDCLKSLTEKLQSSFETSNSEPIEDVEDILPTNLL